MLASISHDVVSHSYVPPLPMHQLQIDLADMKAFGAVPYPYMFVAVDAFTKKVSAIPLKDKKASNTAQGLRKVINKTRNSCSHIQR